MMRLGRNFGGWIGVFSVLAVSMGASACGSPFRGKPSDDTELVPYESREQLEADLKLMLRGEIESRYERALASDSGSFEFGFGAPMSAGMWEDGSAVTNGGSGVPANPFGPDGEPDEDSWDFSDTNNQEAGVDEADLVKTDGSHLYVLDADGLRIFATPSPGDLVLVSRAVVRGRPTQLLIRDGRAIVFSILSLQDLPLDHPLRARVERSQSSTCRWWGSGDSLLTAEDLPIAAKLTVLDVSDRSSPSVTREIYMEGLYQTARRIEDTVLVGFYARPQLEPLNTRFTGGRWELGRQRQDRLDQVERMSLEEMIPALYERSPSGQYERFDLCKDACSNFLRPSNSSARGIATIIALDLLGERVDLSAWSVVSNNPVFYASRDRIYIAEASNDWWWFTFNSKHPDQTNVHAFEITGTGQTEYLASGRVSGRVLNQFSLSEYDGFLRMATTERLDMDWMNARRSPTDTHVFVLGLSPEEGRLPIVGHVGQIEPEEQIFSARFAGDKGYIVTFPDQPTHGADLTPPTETEEICGPTPSGFGTPIDPTIFAGIDPLFTIDLSNPTDPRVMGDLKVLGFSTYIHPIEDERLLTVGVAGDEQGNTWGFQVSLFDVSDFSDPKLVDSEEVLAQGDMGRSEALLEHKAFTYFAPRGLLAVPVSSQEGLLSHTRLELVSVDTASGLSRYGEIDHSPLFDRDDFARRRFSQMDVRRGFFMGDFIYTISEAGIMVHSIEGLEEIVVEAF